MAKIVLTLQGKMSPVLYFRLSSRAPGLDLDLLCLLSFLFIGSSFRRMESTEDRCLVVFTCFSVLLVEVLSLQSHPTQPHPPLAVVLWACGETWCLLRVGTPLGLLL